MYFCPYSFVSIHSPLHRAPGKSKNIVVIWPFMSISSNLSCFVLFDLLFCLFSRRFSVASYSVISYLYLCASVCGVCMCVRACLRVCVYICGCLVCLSVFVCLRLLVLVNETLI